MGENRPQTLNEKSSLMVQVLVRNNLIQALKQVTRNQGAAGIDGMQTETGCYQPQAVLRVEIPRLKK